MERGRRRARLVMLHRVAGHDRSAARADAAVVGFDHLAGHRAFPGTRSAATRVSYRAGPYRRKEPIGFLHRIPGLAHAVALEPAFGLAGLFEAAPLHIEQPAVVAAADAALLNAAIVRVSRDGSNAARTVRLCRPSRNKMIFPKTRIALGVWLAPRRGRSGAIAPHSSPWACRDQPRSARRYGWRACADSRCRCRLSGLSLYPPARGRATTAERFVCRPRSGIVRKHILRQNSFRCQAEGANFRRCELTIRRRELDPLGRKTAA